MESFSPASYKIIKAELSNYTKTKAKDISALIGPMSFSQSLKNSSWLGSLRLIDTIGLLEEFPLRGEETLHLIVRSNDLKYDVDVVCRVYKIDNISTSKINDGTLYDIYITSMASFDALEQRIVKSYSRQTASGIATKIVNEYIRMLIPETTKGSLPYNTKQFRLKAKQNESINRSFYVQPSEGLLSCIVPNYTTFQALNFLARKSYSINSPSSSFKFFETFTSHYFVTDEFLIKRAIDNPELVIDLIYTPNVSRNPKDVAIQLKQIETFKNSTRVSTELDLASGGYKNKIYQIDFLRRRVDEKLYDYTKRANYVGMTGNQIEILDDVHSEEFIKNTFTEENAKRFIIFKDYSGPEDLPSFLRADQHYAEILSDRVAHQHHMSNTMCSITLKGRLDIEPGNIVNITLPNFTGGKLKQNEQLYGKYLVYDVRHTLEENIINTNITLLRYGWKG